MTTGFRVLPSYYMAIRPLDPGTRLVMWDLIMDYAFNGELPQETDPVVQSLFQLMKPNIDKSVNYYTAQSERGKKGGRPRREDAPEEPETAAKGPGEQNPQNPEESGWKTVEKSWESQEGLCPPPPKPVGLLEDDSEIDYDREYESAFAREYDPAYDGAYETVSGLGYGGEEKEEKKEKEKEKRKIPLTAGTEGTQAPRPLPEARGNLSSDRLAGRTVGAVDSSGGSAVKNYRVVGGRLLDGGERSAAEALREYARMRNEESRRETPNEWRR